MRSLRLATFLIFAVACILTGWTVYRDYTRDKTPPTITDTLGPISISVADPPEALLQGLTATDNRDGDLTAKMIVERISRFTGNGVVNVDYVVFDQAGNLCRYSRTVTYKDYSSPRLHLESPLVYRVSEDVAIMDKLKLVDCLGGDITHKLKIQSSNINDSQAGLYEFTASAVTDMGDEVSVRLPVNIMSYDANAPVIELSEYLVYTKAGEPFAPQDYIVGVKDMNGFPIAISEVFLFCQVDLDKPGGGQYRMEVIDSYGRKGYAFLSVIVTE